MTTEQSARAAMATFACADAAADFAPTYTPPVHQELDPEELRERMAGLDHLQMEALCLSLAADVVMWRERFRRLSRGGYK